MSNQQSQNELKQMADALAKELRERATRETKEAAEQLRAQVGEDTDPFTARLLAETLEDFSRLPDYAEALFRRRAERTLRPPRQVREVVVGQAHAVRKNPALPAGDKGGEHNG